jgi:hypothetical protein
MIHDPTQLRPQQPPAIPIPLVAPMEIPPGPAAGPRPPSACTMRPGRRGDFAVDKRGASGEGALVLG